MNKDAFIAGAAHAFQEKKAILVVPLPAMTNTMALNLPANVEEQEQVFGLRHPAYDSTFATSLTPEQKRRAALLNNRGAVFARGSLGALLGLGAGGAIGAGLGHLASSFSDHPTSKDDLVNKLLGGTVLGIGGAITGGELMAKKPRREGAERFNKDIATHGWLKDRPGKSNDRDQKDKITTYDRIGTGASLGSLAGVLSRIALQDQLPDSVSSLPLGLLGAGAGGGAGYLYDLLNRKGR